MKTVTLPGETELLRNTKLYKRLLECLGNLNVKEYMRRDLEI